MFGFITDVVKAATVVVRAPVALVVDTAELTGLTRDSGRSHLSEALKDSLKNLENATKPDKR